MPADFRGGARGPGAFDQRTPGMAVARLGDAALVTPLARRVCRRCSPQGVHQWSGVIKTGEVAEFRPRGHRDRQWHPAGGLERGDDRSEPPGLHVLGKFVCQTHQPCGVVSDRADVFLEHALLRWGGTDHCFSSDGGRASPRRGLPHR
jgi:hypothetical protein